MRKEKKLRCPTCGKEVTWKDNKYRPFCSEKCKLADLSKWFNEEYKVEETVDFIHSNEKEQSEI